MRSVAAIAAVTAVFAGVLVGGLSRTGALDPDMLAGVERDPGAATAGWKTHSVPAAGFSIQLPPEWRAVSAPPEVVFQERAGQKALASLTVALADGSPAPRAPRGMVVERFAVDDHVLTFSTSVRDAASYKRVFEHAADSFRTLRRA